MVVLLLSPAGMDRRLLDLDVAGLPCRQHLVSNLAAVPELDVHQDESVAVAGTQLTDDGVLLVDRDVWLSTPALSQLIQAVSHSTGAVRVVSDDDVLAVYLPGAAARAYRLRDPAAWSEGVSRVSRDFADARQIDGRELAAAGDEAAAMRVGNLKDVALLERRILYGRACRAMEQGTRIRDPHQIAIRGDLHCGADVEIDLNVIVEGTVRLGDGVRIGAHSILIDAVVGAHSVVKPYSILEGTTIGVGTMVGPYGRVRPGSVLGERVQIGNFVEIKNAEIGAGARINHLAFIGDATLGEGATIGAGTITCNHTGAGTGRTVIGANAYVGSGTELVAPVTVGDSATIGAGSTITEDAPPGMLTIARARQVTIPDWAPRHTTTDRK